MRTATRRTPSKAEVLAALQAMQRICQPTAHELATRRMTDAKQAFTVPAQAGLDHQPSAEELAAGRAG